MQKFTIDLATGKRKVLNISDELMQQVLKEVSQRLSGQKKWCPNETLEQIVLNKYTVIELKKNV